MPGGRHPAWGSANALIGLADGVYLELIAFANRSSADERGAKEAWGKRLATNGRSAVESRVLAWQGPSEGLVDFALLPEDMATDVKRARQGGLAIEGPFDGGRTRPDGQMVRWQLAIPETFDVPFVCGDVTDRSLRVPGGEAVRHANGVVGVNRLVVAVADLEAAKLHYRALIGAAPQDIASEWQGTVTAAVNVGAVQVVLAAVGDSSSIVHSILEQRGEGAFLLDLQTSGNQHVGRLDPELAHGAQIRLL